MISVSQYQLGNYTAETERELLADNLYSSSSSSRWWGVTLLTKRSDSVVIKSPHVVYHLCSVERDKARDVELCFNESSSGHSQTNGGTM